MALAVGLAALLPAAPAFALPAVESVELRGRAEPGEPVTFRVRASDPDAPVSGLAAEFGDGGAFGTSACRAGRGGETAAPFEPATPVTLVAPHGYGRAGRHRGLLRLDSGGCGPPTGSTLQPFVATTVEPGAEPVPLVLGIPVPLPVGQLIPSLPGIGELPELPGLPEPLAQLPVLEAGSHSRAARRVRCAGLDAKVRRDAASVRRVRAALLCLINRERQARGLRPLSEERRLRRAANRHSRAMVRGRFFSHYQPMRRARTVVDRLRLTRYLPARSWSVGENIGYGSGRRGTPRSMMRAWMQSTPHRANILEPRFRQVGLGIQPGMPTSRHRGATYTTNFGFRR